jgi:4-alpha-glucanotransferase
VGFSPEGFDSWDYQSVLADGCRIGAPPDPFSQSGQDWGLPPFVPGQLRAQRFEPLRETLRASFSLFDGLRIDHVMGLFRQWWIPPGGTATDGAYVRFPSEELLAVVAIEAHRSGSFVIGEDLGTVEDGVREAMASWGVLGTRVMWFEDRPPSEWPVNALGTVTTHDLPTIAGVWRGIEGDPALVPQICDVTGLQPTAPTAAVVAALHERLARSPAAIRLATLDDVCEAPLRPNVPGTVEPTNWSRPLPVAVEELVHSPRVRSAMLPFTSQAPRGSTGGPLSPERRQP